MLALYLQENFLFFFIKVNVNFIFLKAFILQLFESAVEHILLGFRF